MDALPQYLNWWTSGALIHPKLDRFSIRTPESSRAPSFYGDSSPAQALCDKAALTKEHNTANPAGGGSKAWKLVLGSHLMFFNSW
jgi:hypothetical protein